MAILSTTLYQTIPTSFTATTALGTLANATNSAATADINNATARQLLIALSLDIATQGAARTAGGSVQVFMLPSYDNGTTFARLNETTAEPIWTQPLDAATTAGMYICRDISAWPGHFKLFTRNNTGQAFAGTNTLSYILYSLEAN